jgi:hypothetical protein
LTAIALGAAALGLAADVVSELKAEGYNVQVNGIVSLPLAKCRVTDVNPTLDDSATMQDKQHTMVFVDVSCPSHD